MNAKRGARTPPAELDKLIDWYEQFKPQAGQTIRINLERAAAAAFCIEGTDGRLRYRDRVIEPKDDSNQAGFA